MHNDGAKVAKRRGRHAALALSLAASFLLPLAATAREGAASGIDLGALPAYKPERVAEDGHCHGAVCHGEWGVLRIQASENFQELVSAWQNRFLALHPNIRFQDYFMPSGFGGLVTGTYDIGVMGHTAWRSDYVAFRQAKGYNPLEIMFATGGFDRGKANTPAPIFIVNKDNPIGSLTLDQIDGIFSTERTGGWERDFTWTKAAARSADANIRTWGQLGLTGEWADKPIRLFGFDATLSNWSWLIQDVAFKGGDRWNPALVEMVRGGTKAPADAQIVRAVAEDKYAIAFNLMRVINQEPRVKPLAIARTGSPPVAASAASIFERSYPLVNSVYLYIDRKPNQPLSPRIKEFLRFILSREGQQIVADQGLFFPLNATAVEQERRKLQ